MRYLIIVVLVAGVVACVRVGSDQEAPAGSTSQGATSRGKLFNSDVKHFSAVEVSVRGVTVDTRSKTPVVLLEDKKNRRILPIWIGYSEARAIAIVLEKVETRRPLTHDLIKNILSSSGVKVVGVIISEIRDNIFYARLYLDNHGEEVSVDSRPSDAIAISLRMGTPIYVAKAVFDNAQSIPLEVIETDDIFIKTGIRVQNITEDIAPHFQVKPGEGVLVSEIEDGSPADVAGLRRGDIILEVNGKGIKSVDDFNRVIREAENPSVRLKVRRGDELLDIEVNLEGF